MLTRARTHARTHTYRSSDHTRGGTSTQRGTRTDRYQTDIQRQRGIGNRSTDKTHTHTHRCTDKHTGRTHTQKSKTHRDANRRIHKQQYSGTSTRRGRSRTPTPTANTEGPRREDTPREATTQRGTHRHKQKTPRNTTTRTRRYPQPQARTTRGTHTALDGGVCSVARGRESAPLSAQNAQGAPCCLPQPASAGAHFLRASLNKGPPALGVRGCLCLCLRGSLLPPAAKEATALYWDPKVEVWPLRPLCCAGGQPSSRQQPPPFPAPGARHRASPSPLLPARPVRKQTFPSPVPAPGSMAQPDPRKTGAGGSYLRPRALQSHRLQPVSTVGPRSSARPPRQPLLALPLPGKPPPPPSRQPTSTVHMARLSQWATSPFRSPSRVPSPLPGSGI